MNLTVGPLPPAVYWRRRALVLGAVLALVLLVVAMCGGSGGSNPSAVKPASTATSTTPSPTPSTSLQPPIVGAPGGSSSSAPPPSAAPSSAAPPSPTVRSDTCSDDEIQLTPSIQKVTGGTSPYQLELDIRNISTRTCKRDVGSNPQEMHIVNSAGQTVWSSDYCQSNPGSNVVSFGPNIMDAFKLPWDGYGYATGCQRAAMLVDGAYQLVAKLDTKVSAPVAFTIGGK